MLSVKSVFNVVSNIDLVDYLVSILLQSCREDHNLIVLRHRLDELNASRSHKEETVVLVL